MGDTVSPDSGRPPSPIVTAAPTDAGSGMFEPDSMLILTIVSIILILVLCVAVYGLYQLNQITSRPSQPPSRAPAMPLPLQTDAGEITFEAWVDLVSSIR